MTSTNLLQDAVILDCHVVLEIWLFGDEQAMPLRQAIESGRWRWVSSAPIDAEMRRMIVSMCRRYPRLDAARVSTEAALAQWPQMRDLPPTLNDTPRCKDTDDQMFIDLAVASSPCLLISRDKAVLKLAKRLTPWGVTVLAPAKAVTSALGTPE